MTDGGSVKAGVFALKGAAGERLAGLGAAFELESD